MSSPPSPAIHEVFAYLRVKGAAQAISFYTRAFGAVERFRLTEPDGRIGHAELQLGPAVLMLSESLRGEFAQHHIGVSTVCPGFAETGIMAATEHVGVSADVQSAKRAKATKLYKMRGLQPETVARAMVRAIQKNQPQVMVGMEAHGARFTWRFLPWLSRRIARVDMI